MLLLFLSTSYVIQLYCLVKLRSMSHDIFQIFICDEEKKQEKTIASANFLGMPLFFEALKLGGILTMQKNFIAH